MAVTLVIDNYDSFTYNLVQLLEMLGERTVVVRNDQWTVAQCIAQEPHRVVISPGPGRPEDAGVSVELVRALPPSVPVLGVCLGHQAIAIAAGGQVGPAVRLMHGKADLVRHEGEGLLADLPDPFPAGRYHSLAVTDVEGTLLKVTAHTDDGTVMAIQHAERPVFGIQFHPESILTPDGPTLMRAFLKAGRAA